MIVDPDFCDHWKTRTLVGLLGGDEAAPVYLLRLWAHCQNRRQWRFDGLTPGALKGLCRFGGDADRLEGALAAAGFIRRDGAALVVCGWEEYNRSLIAAWDNGKKGGRPPKEPMGSKNKTAGFTRREEKKREEENTPLPPAGVGGVGNGALPRTKPVPGRRRQADAPAPGFDAFWEAYPRKDAKTRAVQAWNSLRPDPLLLAELLAAITRQRHSAQWLRDGGRYIPLPATWLNGRYWENQGVNGVAAESPQERIARILREQEQGKCNGSQGG